MEGYERVAGVDEAGRGPLAGPVVAAAVVLPPGFDTDGIRDSKLLSPKAREAQFKRIVTEAKGLGVAVVGPEMIDSINILRSTHLAMKQALDAMQAPCDFVLVDGRPVAGLPAPSLAIVDGDCRSASIAAASIVAKVTRDRLMIELDAEYPDYGFAQHKGYCTKQHLEALDRRGPCPCHRKSFAPVFERIAACRLPGLD